jgi:hypothetical protein
MNHLLSAGDREFLREFEACEIAPESFDHPAHVRLAYIYLCEDSVQGATEKMQRSLLAFLAHLGVDAAMFHATITRAWIMAVDHFMKRSTECSSSAEFMQPNPQLLDSKIMLTHYSAEVLFSAEARRSFVEPDIQSIPPP